MLTFVLCPAPCRLFSSSLDKILAAMTIAAERNNKERFASIVEGLENHEAQQLQVWNHTPKKAFLTSQVNIPPVFTTAFLLDYFCWSTKVTFNGS